MSIAKNGFKSAVLWHMNGCIVTFYESETEDQKRKSPTDTISFSSKANLSYRGMNALRIASPAVPFLENLSSLKLQHNNLKSLPSELWRLTNLQELNLAYNQLKELPTQIGLLSNLKELYIHDNLLSELPYQIGNLNLSVLDITSNKLVTVPSGLVKPNLTTFWFLSNNFDDAIPTDRNNLQFQSLKNICLQKIGLLCSEDEDSSKVISESSDALFDKSILLCKQPQLLVKCAQCQSLMYQSGLDLIEIMFYNKATLAMSFKVCSQTCYIDLFNYRQKQK